MCIACGYKMHNVGEDPTRKIKAIVMGSPLADERVCSMCWNWSLGIYIKAGNSALDLLETV